MMARSGGQQLILTLPVRLPGLSEWNCASATWHEGARIGLATPVAPTAPHKGEEQGY